MDTHTYLLRACIYGHTETVLSLLGNHDANILYYAFKNSCVHGHYPIAKMLIDRYASISQHSSMYVRGGAFAIACTHGWADIVELLFEGFRAAYHKLSRYDLTTESFQSSVARTSGLASPPDLNRLLATFSRHGWLRYLHILIQDSCDPKLRSYIAGSALWHCFDFNRIQACITIVNFGSDIDDVPINRIVGYTGNYSYYDCDPQKRTLVCLLIDRFREIIWPSTYRLLLGDACGSGCTTILDMFTGDACKVNPKVHDKVLLDKISQSGMVNINAIVAYIERFRDDLSVRACNAAYHTACHSALTGRSLTLMIVCLRYISDKIDISMTPNNLWTKCVETGTALEVDTVLPFCKDIIRTGTITCIIQRGVRSADVIPVLIKYFRDRIDGRALVQAVLGEVTVHASRATVLAKHIIASYFCDICSTSLELLLGLPTKTLDEVIDASDLKVLIDRHQPDGSFMLIKGTRYMMADYGKQIKGR